MSEKSTDAVGYNVSITGRHVHVTEAMKDYALDKFSRLERFSPNDIIDLQVTMDIQKLEHRVYVLIKFGHYLIQVHAISEDMYKSIDKALSRLEGKLRKYKVKLQNHNRAALPVVDMKVNVLKPLSATEEVNEEIEEENRRQLADEFAPHRVVSSEVVSLKTVTTGHAIMKLELSDDNFLVYRDEEDQKLKVIYRKEDGNFGLVCPE